MATTWIKKNKRQKNVKKESEKSSTVAHKSQCQTVRETERERKLNTTC